MRQIESARRRSGWTTAWSTISSECWAPQATRLDADDLHKTEIPPGATIGEAAADWGKDPGSIEKGATLAAEGRTIIVVEDVMDAVRTSCRRCIVMNSGAKIAEGAVREVLSDPEVVRAYMLEVRGLSVFYDRHRAVENASVAAAEIVVMLGANGVGKSALIRSIAGLAPARPGCSVRMDGEEIAGLPPHEIVEKGIALVPEDRGIFGDLTVDENLTLGAYPDRARVVESTNRERIYGLFPALKECRRQIACATSGGEQQMVAIGRAIMSAPSILLLDEPSLGLFAAVVPRTVPRIRGHPGAGRRHRPCRAEFKAGPGDSRWGCLPENGRVVGADTAWNPDEAVSRSYLGSGER